MRIIDVTLRDGGHAVNFDWGLEFAKEYYKYLNKIKQVEIIEFGYWKQKSKSTKPFYNLNYDYVSEITGNKNLNNISVMIDYHYCSKNLEDYPTNRQKKISMIRICARKEDLDDAIFFSNELKKYTKLNVSLNIFNVANYSKNELEKSVKKVSKSNVDYVYFADTHGSMNLKRDLIMYKKNFEVLKKNNKQIGFHLHDHSGLAYYYYEQLKNYNITFTDASIRGMGKGFGNLRLENILHKKYLRIILNLIIKYEKKLTMYQNPYTLITAKYALTDNYAKAASDIRMDPREFYAKCKKIKGKDKDTFNKKIFT